MKSLCMVLCLCSAMTAAAQTNSLQNPTAPAGNLIAQASSAPAAPKGTTVTKPGVSTEVQPTPKKIRVDAKIVRQAQEKLSSKGYAAGPATGRMNAATRAAVRKFQADEKLKVTGRLDEDTLSHLNIGAGTTMGAAPGDVGRGAKAAGHNIKEGHPIAAAKSMGKGIGRAGKKVGKGTKSAVVGSKDKTTTGDNKSDQTPPTENPKNQ